MTNSERMIGTRTLGTLEALLSRPKSPKQSVEEFTTIRALATEMMRQVESSVNTRDTGLVEPQFRCLIWRSGRCQS